MTHQSDMAAALDTFVAESRERLLEMESTLLRLETETEPGESVNALFRNAHTIKGSAGLFGLHHVVRSAHLVESVLDLLRDRTVTVSAELIRALLNCRDQIATMVERIADDQDHDQGASVERPEAVRPDVQRPADVEAVAAVRALLRPFLADATDPEGTGDSSDTSDDSDDSDSSGTGEPADTPTRYHVSIRFGAGCLRNGMDPLSFIRYLTTLGDIVELTTVTELLPAPAELDPQRCYLGFELCLSSTAPAATIEEVFDFVRDDSRIQVIPHGAPAEIFAQVVSSYDVGRDRVAWLMVRTGAVPEGTLSTAQLPRLRAGSRGTATGLAAADGGAGRGTRSIRVDAQRLDRLIDIIGELVVAGANASVRASRKDDDALIEVMNEVMRLVEEARDSALQLRMVPIGTTFNRFQRIVHDVSADLGRDVALVITGGDTEVDKALVERIGDPLLHLVRNALDHGIEPPEIRVARGKPARGTLRLNAFHDSGSIVIEIEDDGAGIDRESVLAKAVELGLAEPGTQLTDAELHSLIFEPGFSTAKRVSDLSGRGVGMDVVKRNVKALRGTVDVDSRPGVGSTMRIRLPLTLAIIDGFLVGVGTSAFVIPLDRVIECVELPPDRRGHDCMDLRGEVLPFIRLRSLFSIIADPPKRENVVVVEYSGEKIGLVVDALMGGFQTVIKPLGRLFEHIRGIGGFTILGSGEVALIIDVPVLIQQYGSRDSLDSRNRGRQLVGVG